jgi:hypothetical protein
VAGCNGIEVSVENIDDHRGENPCGFFTSRHRM